MKKDENILAQRTKPQIIKCLGHNAFVCWENTGKKDRNICRISTSPRAVIKSSWIVNFQAELNNNNNMFKPRSSSIEACKQFRT